MPTLEFKEYLGPKNTWDRHSQKRKRKASAPAPLIQVPGNRDRPIFDTCPRLTVTLTAGLSANLRYLRRAFRPNP